MLNKGCSIRTECSTASDDVAVEILRHTDSFRRHLLVQASDFRLESITAGLHGFGWAFQIDEASVFEVDLELVLARDEGLKVSR